MVITGVILITISILLGAFGAHGLKSLVSAEKIISFETGVRYQFYHGIGLLIIGLNADKFRFDLKWVHLSILIGVLFFSVSIYFLAIQEVLGVSLKFLGPITPIGGLFMIVGWCILLIKLFRDK
jgi:uncharacterized membrane protein YgdD (TMEM256/DUF423 family)